MKDQKKETWQISSESMQAAAHTSRKKTAQLEDNRQKSVPEKNQADDLATNNDPTIQEKENNTGLPDNLKSGIENLSGHSMDDVKVHYNSEQPAQLNAHAYAQGNQIHVAAGQEKHLPHETWHVVQQKQGRVKPTRQLKEKTKINDDEDLEKEADVMGGKALQAKKTGTVSQLKKILTGSVIQTLPKLKDEKAAIIYFEDHLMDDFEANESEIDDLLNMAKVKEWDDLQERIGYYKKEQKLSKSETLKTFNSLDKKDSSNLPQLVSLLELAQEKDWDDVEEAVLPFVRKLEDERDMVVTEKSSPKKSSRLDLSMLKTMHDLMGQLDVDMDTYKVPLSLTGAKKMSQQIQKFNKMIDRISGEDIFKKSFTVNINVRDLPGYGDVMAGAKLARELAVFYHKFEQWKEVNIRIYLGKINDLKGKLKSKSSKGGGEKEIQKIISMARSVLAGAHVTIEDVDEDLVEVGGPSIDFDYPVPGTSADLSIAQYGHYRLETEHNLGSGPGYGSLGVIPVPKEKQESAISSLGSDTSAMVNAIHQVEHEHKMKRFHFGYFSVYEKRPKEFAKMIAENTDEAVTGIAIAKSADRVDGMAEGLSSVGFDVTVITVLRNGEIQERKTTKGNSKKSNGKKIILLDLPEGVDNTDMLALYYKSDAPVGATGDQSFMEAYTMRSRKNMVQEKTDKKTPDILYDVAPQQTQLYHHVGELGNKSISKEKEASGLKPVMINDEMSKMVFQKNLLFPVVMLINEILQNK